MERKRKLLKHENVVKSVIEHELRIFMRIDTLDHPFVAPEFSSLIDKTSSASATFDAVGFSVDWPSTLASFCRQARESAETRYFRWYDRNDVSNFSLSTQFDVDTRGGKGDAKRSHAKAVTKQARASHSQSSRVSSVISLPHHGYRTGSTRK